MYNLCTYQQSFQIHTAICTYNYVWIQHLNLENTVINSNTKLMYYACQNKMLCNYISKKGQHPCNHSYSSVKLGLLIKILSVCTCNQLAKYFLYKTIPIGFINSKHFAYVGIHACNTFTCM